MPPKNQPQKNTKAVPTARPRGPRPQPTPKPTAKPGPKTKPKPKTSNTRGKPAVKTQGQARQRATSAAFSDVSYQTDVEDSDFLAWKAANPKVMHIPTNFIQDSALPFVMKSIEGDDWEEELRVPVAIVKARQRIERMDMLARERGDRERGERESDELAGQEEVGRGRGREEGYGWERVKWVESTQKGVFLGVEGSGV